MSHALVLSGGGARGAYQAGAIKALSVLIKQTHCPFPIITGASAGAINAAFIAANAENFSGGAARLAEIWSKLSTDQVYETNVGSLGFLGFKLITDLALGKFKRHLRAKSLLDTSPLKFLLEKNIDFPNIKKNVENRNIQSLEISATDYSSSENTSFLVTHDTDISWRRIKRRSEHATISSSHILASTAIPIFFPPIKVGERWFGDGCLRNSAPLSPAIRLGANKIFTIGVKMPKDRPIDLALNDIGMGRILGVLLNSIFMDAIDEDLERLKMLNAAVRLIDSESTSQFREIETLSIMPSIDIGLLAADLADKLPKTMRYLIHGLGTNREASEIISYLMFEPEYCTTLVECGYKDVMAKKEEIQNFFSKSES